MAGSCSPAIFFARPAVEYAAEDETRRDNHVAYPKKLDNGPDPCFGSRVGTDRAGKSGEARRRRTAGRV